MRKPWQVLVLLAAEQASYENLALMCLKSEHVLARLPLPTAMHRAFSLHVQQK